MRITTYVGSFTDLCRLHICKLYKLRHIQWNLSMMDGHHWDHMKCPD